MRNFSEVVLATQYSRCKAQLSSRIDAGRNCFRFPQIFSFLRLRLEGSRLLTSIITTPASFSSLKMSADPVRCTRRTALIFFLCLDRNWTSSLGISSAKLWLFVGRNTVTNDVVPKDQFSRSSVGYSSDVSVALGGDSGFSGCSSGRN